MSIYWYKNQASSQISMLQHILLRYVPFVANRTAPRPAPPRLNLVICQISHPPRDLPANFTNHHRETGRRPQPPSTLASTPGHYSLHLLPRGARLPLLLPSLYSLPPRAATRPHISPRSTPSNSPLLSLPPFFPAAAAAIYQASSSERSLDSPGPLRSRRGRESSIGSSSSRHVVGTVHGLLALAVDHPALPPHRRPPHPVCRRRRTGEVSHRTSSRPRLLLPPCFVSAPIAPWWSGLGPGSSVLGEHRSFRGLNLV